MGLTDTPYNLSGLQSSTDMVNLGSAANDVSGGLLGGFAMLGIFVVVFLMLKGYEDKRAFLASSFITALIGVLFRIMGWTTDFFMFGAILLTGISFLVLMWS